MISDREILDRTLTTVLNAIPEDVRSYVHGHVEFYLSNLYKTSMCVDANLVKDLKIRKSTQKVIFIHSKHIRSKWAIAHEIAHAYLDHIGQPNTEQMANALSDGWGFPKEVKAQSPINPCPRCGEYMLKLDTGYLCSNCGNYIHVDPVMSESEDDYNNWIRASIFTMFLR